MLVLLPEAPATASWLTDQEKHLLQSKLIAQRDRSTGCEGSNPSSHLRAPVTPAGTRAVRPSDSTTQGRPPSRFVSSPLSEQARRDSEHDVEPMPLIKSLPRTLSTWTVYLFASQHFCGATTIYVVLFFQPLMLKELLPGYSHLAIATLASIPMIVAVPVSTLVSWCADRAPTSETRTRRRVWLLWTCGIVSTTLSTLSGVLLIVAGQSLLSSRWQHVASVSALILGGASVPALSGSVGSLWALHHASQPPELRSTSISVVNSLGNLGGFIGPYLLGALRGPLGPMCPTVNHTATDCVYSWGGDAATAHHPLKAAAPCHCKSTHPTDDASLASVLNVGGVLVVSALTLCMNLINLVVTCTKLLPRLTRNERPVN